VAHVSSVEKVRGQTDDQGQESYQLGEDVTSL
jgi:hypothetical protein